MKKKLSFFLKKNSGRNSFGCITVRHRGGGHRRRYRFINFNYIFINVSGIIYNIEYDPNRNCSLGLILYKNGLFGYILGYQNMKIGDLINSNKNLLSGSSFLLKNVPVGSLIYNVELVPGKGGQIGRSGGSFCQIINKYIYGELLVLVKFKSKEEYLLDHRCKAFLGVVNSSFKKQVLYKAGQNRWVGKRPKVRGVAMNPVDHPHGGGEGKTSGGRPSVSFKGVITKGKPTRRLCINKFIKKRRDSK